jgi:pimeloyl-ACP methyl ester carboxylesterase
MLKYQTAQVDLIDIHGHRLSVESHGPASAPVVVLLHHGLGSVRAWKHQVPSLLEAGYRTLAYDRWGYGKSDPRPSLSAPYFEDDLIDLHALLVALDIERANLIGHSDGGTIALYFAAKYPAMVTKLITVAAHIYIEPKMKPSVEGIQLGYENDPRLREGLRRLHGDKTERVFNNWFNAWTNPKNLSWDMRHVLNKISCPALVVQGSDDEHATPNHARDIADALPNSALWLEPNAKHMLPQDDPTNFNRIILDFLSK